MQYSFDGKIPELSGTVKAFFMLVLPTLDKSKARSMSGSKGGKSKSEATDKQSEVELEVKDDKQVGNDNDKQNSSKNEANDKQNSSKNEFCFPETAQAKVNFALLKEKEKEKEKEEGRPPLPPKDPILLLSAAEYLKRLGYSPPGEGDKYFTLLEAMFELADTFPEDQRDRDHVHGLFSEVIDTYGDRNILRTVRNLTDHQRAPSPRTNKGKPYVRLGATLRNWLDNERPEIEEGSVFYERVSE
jgi:hypothetical protein